MDSNPSSTIMWSNVVKRDPPSKLSPPISGAPSSISGMIGNCKSTKGISMAVIDANAVIEGNQSLTYFADKFVTVTEVISEIRDPASRRRLAFIPFAIDTMEPSPESLNKVIKFARSTGDLQTLSDVDLKLIALTYTLESQIHGTENLRDVPPQIQTVKVKRLDGNGSHGWGSLESHKEVEGERKHRRYPPKKTEVKKGKMVVEGVDASRGECGGDDSGGWTLAVSSGTHRKFLRRMERKLTNQISNGVNGSCGKDSGKNDEDVSSMLKDMRLEEDSSNDLQDGQEETNVEETLINGEDDIEVEEENLEIASEASSVADDGNGEQSLPSSDLPKSSVACITGDYAMQNVILHMGLRLLAPGGMQIRQLRRWILQCHGCYTFTPDIGRIFCHKCGNGGTLRKVSVTIDENGTIVAARKPRITLRGTKFSIPMPKGGRDAITKNMVLREDQLPQKFLHPKTKKKATKLGDEYFGSDDVFINHHSDKKAPLQPHVRKAMAVFSQRRNPNDNYYSR
ncbi:unnamed protein product [Cochlearia groenlandica]